MVRNGFFLAVLLVLGVTLAPEGVAQEGPYPYPGNRQRLSADRSPSSGQLQALTALRSRMGAVEVRWDRETGGPRGLSGRLSRPFIGSAREAALRFISETADLLIADPVIPEAFTDPRSSPLRVSRVTRREKVDHVTLLQFHGDLPVLRGGYTVSLRRRPGPGGSTVRRVVSTMGTFFSGIPETFDTTPTVGRDGALEAALEGVAPGVEPSEPPMERLLIYPLNGAYLLAWQVDFRTKEPLGRWRVFVDARNGSILEVRDRIMHGNVTGDVWLHNPVQDPTPIPLPLRDAYVIIGGNLAVTDAMGDYDDGGASTVTTFLAGPYCRATNEDAPDVTYTGPPDVVWSYPLWDTHFDEVNVFYHVNIFHDYLRNTLGFSGADIQLPAMVHLGTGYNNAYYDGTGIFFGDGDGVNWTDFAQDDVIYHEYGHFMFDRAISMGYGWNEVGGMDEGGADFFSCTSRGDPELGEAVRLNGNIRNLDNKTFNPPRIYPDFLIANNFEPHRGGEVWGGALWDIRKDIGRMAIDPVAWEALFYLPPAPLFLDGRAGCVQADIDLFFGIHKRTIEQLMFERGIGPPPSTDPFVRIQADPEVGLAPLPVVFTGIVVDDGFAVSYDWDLGDGTVVSTSTPVVTHSYPNPGVYTVTLVATDDTGATGSWSLDVEALTNGEILLAPQEKDIGFVRSDQPMSNFFGDDDVYAGFLSSTAYTGAALFRLPYIPGGTSNLIFDSVTLEMTGQDDTPKAPAGGIWSVKMLSEEIDSGWRLKGYLEIVSAFPLYTLDPPLSNGDLLRGGLNVFSVSSAQLPALHHRLAGGTVSFRIDGPYGVNNLFSWDSGFDRYGEDPTATRVKPVLRVKYTQARQTGDVNADGVVNGTDARLAAEAVLGMRVLSQEDLGIADADRNGTLDSRDAAAIEAKAAGVLDF